MPSPMISFRAVPPLDALLTARRRHTDLLADPLAGPPADPSGAVAIGAVAARDLRMYYRLLAAELADANLSRRQAEMIGHALLGVFVDATWLEDAPTLLASELIDATCDDLGDDDPDAAALAADIRRWPRLRAIAVIDAALAWHTHPLRDTDPEAALREVGLLPRRPHRARRQPSPA